MNTSPDRAELGQDGRGRDCFASHDTMKAKQVRQENNDLLARRQTHAIWAAHRVDAMASVATGGLSLANEQRDALPYITSARDPQRRDLSKADVLQALNVHEGRSAAASSP